MRVVASYGDFADRRLGVPNWVMLKDQEFRRDVGIDLETYDPAFLSQLPSRHSDVPYPRDRDPTDPADAVRAGTPVICVLVHPRHWRADRMVNARDDARRLIEGIRVRTAARNVKAGVTSPRPTRRVSNPGTTAGPPPEQVPTPSDRPRVAMALYGDLTYDSRIRREARALAEAGYDVVIVCLAVQGRPTDFPEAVTVRVQPAPRYAVIPGSTNPFFETRNGRAAALRGRVRWLTSYVRGLRAWGRLAVRAAGPVQIWHAHDLTGLAAISPNLPDDIPLVYDSHEHLVETVSALRLPAPARRLLRAYERRLISRASAVVTVNQAVASVLRRRYRPARMIAVHNCPDLWEVPVERPDRLRAAAGISEQSPVILYHGALSANRGIEQLMEAILQPGAREDPPGPHGAGREA